MEFVYTQDPETGKRTIYTFASHAPKGAELHTFTLENTSKDGLCAAFQELFDMIEWNKEAKAEEPKAPLAEQEEDIFEVFYENMTPKQVLKFRTLLDTAWPLLPVAYRSDLIVNFMEEVIRPLKVNYASNPSVDTGADSQSAIIPTSPSPEEET